MRRFSFTQRLQTCTTLTGTLSCHWYIQQIWKHFTRTLTQTNTYTQLLQSFTPISASQNDKQNKESVTYWFHHLLSAVPVAHFEHRGPSICLRLCPCPASIVAVLRLKGRTTCTAAIPSITSLCAFLSSSTLVAPSPLCKVDIPAWIATPVASSRGRAARGAPTCLLGVRCGCGCAAVTLSECDVGSLPCAEVKPACERMGVKEKWVGRKRGRMRDKHSFTMKEETNQHVLMQEKGRRGVYAKVVGIHQEDYRQRVETDRGYSAVRARLPM